MPRTRTRNLQRRPSHLHRVGRRHRPGLITILAAHHLPTLLRDTVTPRSALKNAVVPNHHPSITVHHRASATRQSVRLIPTHTLTPKRKEPAPGTHGAYCMCHTHMHPGVQLHHTAPAHVHSRSDPLPQVHHHVTTGAPVSRNLKHPTYPTHEPQPLPTQHGACLPVAPGPAATHHPPPPSLVAAPAAAWPCNGMDVEYAERRA